MSSQEYSVCSYRAFIDESGDEGFAFKRGSSLWFVISAVIVPDTDEVEAHLVSILDETRMTINKVRNQNIIPQKKPLHFRDLKHDERRYFAQSIGKSQFIRTVTVAVHKPSLDREIFRRQGNRLFLYVSRLLIERISWCCRDWAGLDGESSVRLVFSNKGGLKSDEIKKYLKRLSSKRDEYQYRGVPNINIEGTILLSAGRSVGLQFADAVASSYYFALEKNRFGMTEPAYVELLRGLAYASPSGHVFGNGFKVFPAEAVSLLQQEMNLQKIVADPGP